jgi:hypothetical protein
LFKKFVCDLVEHGLTDLCSASRIVELTSPNGMF